MPRDTRFPSVFLIVAALFASSCQENVQPNTPAPATTSPTAAKNNEEKKSGSESRPAGNGDAVVTAATDSEEKTSESTSDAPDTAANADSKLFDPSLAKEKAPAKFNVKFKTTKGDFEIEVTREWAPNGADRFYNLVKIGYFKDVAFFRNIDGFMVQFGIHGDPAVNAKWRTANIQDDPVKQSNKPGYLTYAQSGAPNSRSTQYFINFGDNSNLDGMRFAPFGRVVEGMDVVKSLYNGYGEGAPRGFGPDQGRVQFEGNAYLKKDFPKLDYIKSASIVE